MPSLSEKQRDKLPDSDFAFPKERKEPLVDAEHVRQALARFDQIEGMSNKERDDAFKRIKRAAERHGVEMHESSWQELFRRNGRTVPKD